MTGYTDEQAQKSDRAGTWLEWWKRQEEKPSAEIIDLHAWKAKREAANG